jgi:ABC-type Fe3+ transport system substrate-binding protein
LNISLLASSLKRYKEDKDKLWKELLDYKYKTRNPNILMTRTTNSSSFFKGSMWATQAARMGYKWKVGDGKKD